MLLHDVDDTTAECMNVWCILFTAGIYLCSSLFGDRNDGGDEEMQRQPLVGVDEGNRHPIQEAE